MRLLFDQTLSHRLNETLEDLFPDSMHLRDAGLGSADDIAVWEYAKTHSFTIASKDSDFRQLSFTLGHPSKVIWIRRGNCSTAEIASILRSSYDVVLALHTDPQGSFLALN